MVRVFRDKPSESASSSALLISFSQSQFPLLTIECVSKTYLLD